MIRLESCLMSDIKAEVGLSSFFCSFPCLYLMLLCYWPPSPKGEWEVVSHLLPVLLILFFFSLGSHSSCIFIRKSCLFADPCAYLVLCLAIFVYFVAFCMQLHLSFLDILVVTLLTIHIVKLCLAIQSQCYKVLMCCC